MDELPVPQLFMDIYQRMPRQGPGNEASTLKALAAGSSINVNLHFLSSSWRASPSIGVPRVSRLALSKPTHPATPTWPWSSTRSVTG
jgi:hypothetical protein